MTKKKIISVYSECPDYPYLGPSDFDDTLGNVKSLIDKLIASHGPEASLEFDLDHHEPYDPDPSPRVRIKISREETDKEFEERVDGEMKRQDMLDKFDLIEFERLQKKFMGEK